MPIRIRAGGRLMNPTQFRRMKRRQYRKRVPKGGKRYSKNPLVRLIQRVVSRNQETKYVANYPSDGAGASLGVFWYTQGNMPNITNFYPAIPALTQGTDDYERVGNKIHLSNLALSVRVGFNAQDTKAQSLLGVLIYGVDKAGKTWNNVHPLQTASILDNGDGTNTTFGGTRADLNKPLDKKLVTARRIVFRLSKTEGLQNSDVSGASVVAGNYSTSNGLSEKSFLLKFKNYPRNLMYATHTDTFPQNFAPWWAIGFCHADGSALTADDANLVNVTSKCHMYFKDA